MTAVSHILSTKSKSYERDTFIFSTTVPARLMLGLNQRRTPISSATWQRWASIMAPYCDEFVLRPVTIHKYGIMAYAITPNGPPIPKDSSEPLPIGNYGWCLADGSFARFFPMFLSISHPSSFATMKETWTHRPNHETMLDVTPSEAQVVMQRDQHRCFITGTEFHNDTDLVWMFPPSFTDLNYYLAWADGSRHTPEIFETASNAAFLHKDLISSFYDNAFSIDVDDNHHVLIFRDIGPAEKLLPSHLKVVPNQGPDDLFLREHFRMSLRVCLLDGDISEDYPQNTVLDMMDDLGVSTSGGDDALELAPMTDPRWQTVLGKQIWENVLQSRIAERRVPPDDSDEEDTDPFDRSL